MNEGPSSGGATDVLRKQALAAFLAQLLRFEEEAAEDDALAKFVNQVGARLSDAFLDFDRLVERVTKIRRHVEPVLGLLAERTVASQPAPERAETRTTAGHVARPSSDDARIAEVLEAIDHVTKIEHVAPRLAKAAERAGVQIGKVPRRGSRGNGLLFVMDRYGRSADGLSLELLMLAFDAMGAVDPGQDPRRVAQWEASELLRRGWPVERTPNGRYRYSGPKMEDSAV